ncbi:MAG: choice-of-anchor V domain-containing protein, partial [Blastocatellia bacterium]
FTAHRVAAFRSGPPPSQTGAPSEGTCASCHFSFPLNSGGGTFTITGLPANYSSGQEVDITITLTQSNRALYGFQVTALNDAGGQAGTLIVTDPARTQTVTGSVGGGRTYIEHTFGGTTPSATNQGIWTFRWRAPATSAGRVTFYAAGNAANGNGSTDGDFIYTTTAVTQPVAQPAPTIANLNPNLATAGGPAFTLIVTGTSFVSGSIVRWNNSDRTTTVVSATQLSASIPATDIAVAGTANVTVVNPGNISSNASVFTIAASGLEADVAPRGNVNGVVSISDWVQVGRFAAGLDVVNQGSEFQRADCAPIATQGNGVISIADWVQAGRYATGLDPIAPAGGPTGPISASIVAPDVEARASSLDALPEAAASRIRVVRATPAAVRSGRLISLIIQLEAPGDAHALGFSLNFNPDRLRFAGATSSREMSRAAFVVNTDQADRGRVGVLSMLPPGQRLPSGVRSLMAIHFIAVADGSLSDAQVSFGDDPVAREIADAEANLLPAAFQEIKSVGKMKDRKMKDRKIGN